jgi:hypothetical protein
MIAMISAMAALLCPSSALAVALAADALPVLAVPLSPTVSAVAVAATAVPLAVGTAVGSAVGTAVGTEDGAAVGTDLATGLVAAVGWGVVVLPLAERLKGAIAAAKKATLAQNCRAILVSLREFRRILYLKEILSPME